MTDTPLLNTMYNSSRRDKGQLKAKNNGRRYPRILDNQVEI